MNQQVIFLSDGGDDVRNLQLYLNPFAEHVLDWFHITMRLTVLEQLAKGAVLRSETGGKKNKRQQREEEEPEPRMSTCEKLVQDFERIKWHLWHGNVFRALQIGEDIEEDLGLHEGKNALLQKLLQAMREFK